MKTFVMNSDRARLIQSEKMSAAGNLLAGIVHELNNPLTTILGFSELMIREGALSDGGRLEKIRAEAERSIRIVQNVLRLARADGGDMEIIDVNDVIRRTAELGQYQLRLNRIRFDLNLSDRKPQVLARVGELTQVLLNLVTNAVQAISSVSTTGSIQILSVLVHDRVRVSVIDDGPGIRETDLPQIF